MAIAGAAFSLWRATARIDKNLSIVEVERKNDRKLIDSNRSLIEERLREMTARFAEHAANQERLYKELREEMADEFRSATHSLSHLLAEVKVVATEFATHSNLQTKAFEGIVETLESLKKGHYEHETAIRLLQADKTNRNAFDRP